MSNNWKIGDRVLCVHSTIHPNGYGPVKGNEYTVNGFGCCAGCGCPTIFLKELPIAMPMICDPCSGGCGAITDNDASYDRADFIKPDLASLEQHRAEVSAKELLEIKTLQHQ